MSAKPEQRQSSEGAPSLSRSLLRDRVGILTLPEVSQSNAIPGGCPAGILPATTRLKKHEQHAVRFRFNAKLRLQFPRRPE
jgi:hypothetical protein